MAAPVLQFKRGEFANLPALRAGEPGFTTDRYDLYVGLDGNLANNKFFGSHRYWIKEGVATGSGINLVEGTGSGDDYITLAAPVTVGAAVTYYFPATQGASSSVLTNDGSGNLSWSSGSENATFTGITTFSDTTDNTLGDSNTGSVLFDGGVGIDKNLTIGGNLNVQGYSEFVGVATFKGGTINLGDANTDDINVAGEFISDLIPNATDTYSLGTSSKQWKDLYLEGTADIDALTVSGVSTFTGLIDANGGLDVVGGATLNELNVTGVSTYGNSVVINGNIDVTGISTFTNSIDANGNLDVAGNVSLSTLNVVGVSTFGGAIDASGSGGATIDNIRIALSTDNEIDTTTGGLTLDSSAGTVTIDDDLSVTGVSTFTGAIDANGGLDVSGGEATFGSATVSDLTSGRIVLAGTSGALTDDASLTYSDETGLVVGNSGINVTGISTFSTDLVVTGDLKLAGGDIRASNDAVNITITSNTLTTFAGDIRVNGNDIQASDGQTNVSLTSSTLTTFAGDIRVNGNDIQASDGQTNLTMTSNTLTEVKGDLQVSGNDIKSSGGSTAITMSGGNVTVAGDLTVGGSDIKASDGTTSITLSDVTGNVGVSSDLTVSGNLFVNGSTTQVNTTTLTVEDTLVEFGLVDGNPPSSDVNKDIGILLNYYTASAKKAAVYWDDSASRIVVADDVSESSSVLTAAAYAALEIGSLWVNDCAGQSQVISCTGSERFLENITIDGGSF
jgi:hypothetical protein